MLAVLPASRARGGASVAVMSDNGDWTGHVVVFGFHGVARRIVRQLHSTGYRVVVVENDATPAEREAIARYGAHYLPGFRQSEGTLEAAGVERAHAVVCATNDDLRNIELALLVRERSTRVRIVVQMANAAVGRALETVTHPGAVLEVAALAAPSFVNAVIGQTTQRLDIDGSPYLMSTFTSDSAGTCRGLWGDLVPVAITRAGGTDTITCPRRDTEIAPGDEATLLGTATDFERSGTTPVTREAAARPRRPLRRMRESLGAISELVDRPFKIAAAVLGALMVISVALLLFGYREPDGTGMNLLDAVYFTSETIATVGFGDFYFRDQDAWLRIWSILVILLGATLIAVATALLTNALVTRSLNQSLGRQRLTGMRGHLVVIGLGSVGSKVASQLHRAGFEVAIVDSGEGQRFYPQMRSEGMPVLVGDVTLQETLKDAGVDRAAGVAILTSDDLVNIETGLAVRDAIGAREMPIVLRVFGRSLARVVDRNLDAGTTRSIAELSAPWFVGAAVGLDVVDTFYVGSSPFMVAGMDIHGGSGLDGIAVTDVAAQTRVIAIRKPDGPLERPTRDTVLRDGDRAYLIGHYDEVFRVISQA